MNKDWYNFKKVNICGKIYKYRVCQQISSEGDIVSIVIPVFNAFEITKLCLDCIKKYTTIPYVIWIVDNHSSKKNKKSVRTVKKC